MEALHAWAVAPAAIGTCCLAADRARVRPPELVASALMPLAMLDAGLTALVAPVFWTALLLAAAMGLAVWRTPRRARTARIPTAMTLHTALGLIVMAALQVSMVTPTSAGASTGHAHHSVAFAPLVLAACAGYAALSIVITRRMPARLDRLQLTTMAASVGLMALGLL